MTLEDELLIACMRQDFTPEQCEEVACLARGAGLDWDKVVSTAVEQGVAPLLHMNLARCSPAEIGVPVEVMERLQLSEVQAVAIQNSRAARLQQLLAFLHNKSIEAMLIKGAALEVLVYDRPWVATTNDIDLILGIEVDEFSENERAGFHELAGGFSLEYDFVTHHDVTMNGILPVDFERVWADAQTAEYRGQPCLVMSAEDMLITLCINSCRKRYFRLKSLFDIAETIDRCQDLHWPRVFEKAQAYRSNYMVYAALLAAQATVGCRLPETLRNDLALSAKRARIIQTEIVKRISQPLFGTHPTRKILGRPVDSSLTLAYLTYRWDQILKRAWYVWRTRKRPMGVIGTDRMEPSP